MADEDMVDQLVAAAEHAAEAAVNGDPELDDVEQHALAGELERVGGSSLDIGWRRYAR